ncbi:MAG: acetyl-CoA carboxylase biotin carboxyl carrier protein [Singulisphaera sp.]
MPENETEPTEPIDVQTIRHLGRLMKKFDLTAIDFNDGTTQIRMRRRGGEAVSVPGTPASVPGTLPASIASPPTSPAPALPPTTPASPGVVIESPMVGTYYASSSPDVPPFVSVGSVVHEDSTVCVIEAMKVFTDIPAGVSGTIAEILVKNGQSVEFGQALFRVHSA